MDSLHFISNRKNPIPCSLCPFFTFYFFIFVSICIASVIGSHQVPFFGIFLKRSVNPLTFKFSTINLLPQTNLFFYFLFIFARFRCFSSYFVLWTLPIWWWFKHPTLRQLINQRFPTRLSKPSPTHLVFQLCVKERKVLTPPIFSIFMDVS